LPHHEAETRLRERLIGLGYREILTIPHVAEDRDALFRTEGVAPARLANPLSEEANVLRSTGVVSMAAAIEWNLNHGQRNARLFEIGRHYRLNGSESVETRVLTLGATGEAREKGLYDSAREFSFADLKGDLDSIGELAINGESGNGSTSGFEWRDGGPDWLHTAKRGKILSGATEVGSAGQLARRVADKFKLRQEVFLAELELDRLYAAIRTAKDARRYEPLPRFPAVERDFSLLLADGISFAEIADSIRSLQLPELHSIQAVDLFRGKNVPAGKYSLLVRVTFQSREGTLTEGQINHYTGKIISILEHRHAAQLRAS
jgi:phenylalanyl-tRNA synthetase beta chain